MRQVVAAAALLALTGCTWSNSLYQAKVNSAAALRAEREGRPGDAENAWGVAAVKAESAFVRRPRSETAAEALWLQGRALARRRDCGNATPALERSTLLRRNAPWRESLLLELARCREVLQDGGAVALFEELSTSRDTAVSRDASRRAGEALVRDGRWSEALSYLATLDDARSRLNRATALAALDRSAESRAELRTLLLTADSSLDFVPLVRAQAGRSSIATDSLLLLLSASRIATPERQSRWLLGAIRGTEQEESAVSDRYLGKLLTFPGTEAAGAGVLLAVDRTVARAHSPGDLKVRLDSLGQATDEGLARRRAEELRRLSIALLDEEAATRAGGPQGDLVLFVLGENARDSLRAPALASWLFARVERDWPQSPYVAKAILARLPIEPDSGGALRARLAALPPGNAYLAYLLGRQDSGFVQLEDSLRSFLLYRARAASGRRGSAPGGAPLP
ncbi:MAG: hypothetical protein V4558_11745 [Gemmatimonadota bacterium]